MFTPNLITVRIIIKILVGYLMESELSWIGTNPKDYLFLDILTY